MHVVRWADHFAKDVVVTISCQTCRAMSRPFCQWCCRNYVVPCMSCDEPTILSMMLSYVCRAMHVVRLIDHHHTTCMARHTQHDTIKTVSRNPKMHRTTHCTTHLLTWHDTPHVVPCMASVSCSVSCHYYVVPCRYYVVPCRSVYWCCCTSQHYQTRVLMFSQTHTKTTQAHNVHTCFFCVCFFFVSWKNCAYT